MIAAKTIKKFRLNSPAEHNPVAMIARLMHIILHSESNWCAAGVLEAKNNN